MPQLNDYLSCHHWHIFDDQSLSTPLTPDEALAYQDSFIRWIPTLDTATPTGIVHFYPTSVPTILLGAKDTRLSQFHAGLQFLRQQGYTLSLRSHGGLAVVCDDGVLNIGLASDLTHFPLSIDEAYEQMVALIHQTLQPFGLTVTAYEIANSYCPGTYDLVVNGQKIGGIAQRRFKNGLTTAAYLSVTGPQSPRAQLIRQFYQAAHADDTYPLVDPLAMTSISELLNEDVDLSTFKQWIMATIQKYSTLCQGQYSNSDLQQIFKKMLATVYQRNLALSTPKEEMQ